MSNPSKLGIFVEYFHTNMTLSAKLRQVYSADELEKIDTIILRWWQDIRSIQEDTRKREMAVDARTDAELRPFISSDYGRDDAD